MLKERLATIILFGGGLVVVGGHLGVYLSLITI